MKRASRYALAVIIPFLIISIAWAVADMRVYGDREPAARWAGYEPKGWVYLIVNVLILTLIVAIAVKKVGSPAVIPFVYGVAAGCYFFYMRFQHAREWEDLFLVRPFLSCLGLIPMALRDMLTTMAEAFAESRGKKPKR